MCVQQKFLQRLEFSDEKTMKFISIISGMVLIAIFTINNHVYADYHSDGTWFCNPNNLYFEKIDYEINVGQLDGMYKEYTAQEISNRILNDFPTRLEEIGKRAHCLRDNGIDPSSVATIDPHVLEGVNYVAQHNPEKLVQVAPEFAKYVPIPEFGSLAGMITAISIIGVITISRKFDLRF